jgi:hypothetical protein
MTIIIDSDGHLAEDTVASELRKAGWEVLDLNRDIAGNFPVADLIARNDAARPWIQVRGTTLESGDFTVYPEDARKAECFGAWLGHPVLYAFVHQNGGKTTVRYAAAAEVAKLAEEWQAEYLLTHQKPPRYHINIDDFDIDVDRIAELLDPSS